MEKKIDLSRFLEQAGLVEEHVEIIETPGMYPHKEKVEENWSYYTGWGFRQLKEQFESEGKRITDLAIIGIGSGVEGILAAKFFKPDVHNLIVTDIDSEVVDGAVRNIKNSLHDMNIKVTPLIGSYCEPLERSHLTVDVVYGNIPNLPSTKEADLSLGAEKGTFVPTMLYHRYNPPQKYTDWALGSQFAYLQSAKKVLRRGGSVVSALGGRVPLDVVRELFADCELQLVEVTTGFKEQTEALIDFQGYHLLEREGSVSFEFYLYEQAGDLMKQKGIVNPSSHISGEALKTLLEPFKVSAGKALELYEQKVPIGHTVHLFRGIK